MQHVHTTDSKKPSLSRPSPAWVLWSLLSHLPRLDPMIRHHVPWLVLGFMLCLSGRRSLLQSYSLFPPFRHDDILGTTIPSRPQHAVHPYQDPPSEEQCQSLLLLEETGQAPCSVCIHNITFRHYRQAMKDVRYSSGRHEVYLVSRSQVASAMDVLSTLIWKPAWFCRRGFHAIQFLVTKT